MITKLSRSSPHFLSLYFCVIKNEKEEKMSQEDFNLSTLDVSDLGDFDMDLNLDDMEKVSTRFK